MSRENPLWGAPRIHGELSRLGIDIGQTSVGKFMVRQRRPPSQTWRTFLEHHVKSMVSVDFLNVPTIRFRILYVFLVLAHDRRRIVVRECLLHVIPERRWVLLTTGHETRCGATISTNSRDVITLVFFQNLGKCR